MTSPCDKPGSDEERDWQNYWNDLMAWSKYWDELRITNPSVEFNWDIYSHWAWHHRNGVTCVGKDCKAQDGLEALPRGSMTSRQYTSAKYICEQVGTLTWIESQKCKFRWISQMHSNTGRWTATGTMLRLCSQEIRQDVGSDRRKGR